MEDKKMNITTTIEEAKVTFKTAGELSVSAAEELSEAIENLPEEICDIDIDLEDAKYVTSAGLRAIMQAEKVAEENGGCLRVLHPNGDICGIFEMTGLDAVLEIIP